MKDFTDDEIDKELDREDEELAERIYYAISKIPLSKPEVITLIKAVIQGRL